MVRGVVLDRDAFSVIRQHDVLRVERGLGRSIVFVGRQLEAELIAILPVTAGQLLGHFQVLRTVQRGRLHLVGVGEASGGDGVSRDGAGIVLLVGLLETGGHLAGRGVLGHRVLRAGGQAVHPQGLPVLECERRAVVHRKLVAHLGGAVLGKHLGLERLVCGKRVTALVREAKRESEVLTVQEVVSHRQALSSGSRLGHGQHARELHGNAAVIAQVGIDLRPHALVGPSGIVHEACRDGGVAGLLKTCVVHTHCASGTSLDENLVVIVAAPHRALGLIENTTRHRLDGLILLGCFVALERVERARIVVGCGRIRLTVRQRNLARLILIEGRISREVVEAVTLRRLEARGGIAIVGAVHLRVGVGVEVDGAAIGGRVGFDVSLERVVRIREVLGQLSLEVSLQPHRVVDLNRVDVGNRHGVVIGIDIELAQRDELGGNLNRHRIAGLRIVGAALGHGDLDVAQVAALVDAVAGCLTRKGVGSRVALCGRAHRIEGLARVNDRREVADLHVIAEFIGEGDIA